jgi:hypothetical protein
MTHSSKPENQKAKNTMIKNTKFKITTSLAMCAALLLGACTAPEQSAIETGAATLATDFLTGATSAQKAADGGSTVASLAQSYLGLTIPANVLSDSLSGSGLKLTPAVKSDLAGVITPTTITNLWTAVDHLYTKAAAVTAAPSSASNTKLHRYITSLKRRSQAFAYWCATTGR